MVFGHVYASYCERQVLWQFRFINIQFYTKLYKMCYLVSIWKLC